MSEVTEKVGYMAPLRLRTVRAINEGITTSCRTTSIHLCFSAV